MSIDHFILSIIRRWWRPVTCVALALTVFVHGVFIPLYLLLCKNQYFSDLNGLSLLITAVIAAFAVREWGKVRGNE